MWKDGVGRVGDGGLGGRMLVFYLSPGNRERNDQLGYIKGRRREAYGLCDTDYISIGHCEW